MTRRTALNSTFTRLVATCAVVLFPSTAFGQQPQLYQFQPGQSMRYDVTLTEDGEVTTGFYEVSVAQAAGGQVQVTIEAEVGDNSCNTSSTVAPGAGVAGQMMMTCFTLIPVASALFAPTWAMFMGQSMNVGNSWTMGNVSFNVTENCTYAGVTGVRMIMTEDGEVKIETCYSDSYPLPIFVMFATDDNSSVELTLTDASGA